MCSRREFTLGAVGAVAFASAGLGWPRTAGASTTMPVDLDHLVYYSSHVVVARPLEAASRWVTMGRQRRIVTETLVRVEQPIDGRPPNSQELMVRTLGGQVGDLGQIVAGEAVLRHGEPGILFLSAPSGLDMMRVTAMAQGHYLLQADGLGELRAQPSMELKSLMNHRRAAVAALMGHTVPDVENMVHACLQRLR